MQKKSLVMILVVALSLGLLAFGCTGKPTGTKATFGGWITSATSNPYTFGNGKANFGGNFQVLEPVTDGAGDLIDGVYLAKGQLQYADHSYSLETFLDCFFGYDTVWQNFESTQLNIHGIPLLAKFLQPVEALSNGVEFPTGYAFGIFWPKVPFVVDGLLIDDLPLVNNDVIAIGFFLVKVVDKGEPGAVDGGDEFKIWLTNAFITLSSPPTTAELVSAMQATIAAVESAEPVNDFSLCYSNDGVLQGGNIQVKIVTNNETTSTSGSGKGK